MKESQENISREVHTHLNNMENILSSTQIIWSLDGWIILVAIACALNTALLGNFLLLRKMSMVGDAITHAVLPGLALAFILFESRDGFIMLLAAVSCAVVTVIGTEFLREKGHVDEGAALGVIFIGLFALGLVLIVHGADSVDLDPSCVLFGNIEMSPLTTTKIFNIDVPTSFVKLSALFFMNVVFVITCFRHLVLSSFDEGYSIVQGSRPKLLHYILLILVAVTAVISFEVVGSILVVAMFVVPAACAHLLSNKLKNIIYISLGCSVLFSVAGHLSAIYIPSLYGYQSISTAGMIATVSGVFFFFLMLFAPQRGIMSSLYKYVMHSYEIKRDDLLSNLYRQLENNSNRKLHIGESSFWIVLICLVSFYIRYGVQNGLSLTSKGREYAINNIRRHRLWELYLNSELGYDKSIVHPFADGFEHYTDSELTKKLQQSSTDIEKDPHGRDIP